MKFQGLIREGLQSWKEFNLFTKDSPNPLKSRQGRLASRLYLILFAITLIVLALQTSIAVQTFRETISTPTQTQYLTLYEKYPSTLECPCSIISVAYEEMMELQPTYHQICSG